MGLKNSRKGILFTLGLTFLGLVIMALAVLIFHNAQKSEGIVSKLVVLDRVYDLDSSIEKSLVEIFNQKSGITVSVDGNVSFQESFPNLNVAEFTNSMNDFKTFIESNFSNINISVSEIVSEVPIVIMPYNITYKHVNYGGKQIEVVPQQINFEGYSVSVSIDENVSSCDSEVDEGDFNLLINVTGLGGSSCSVSELIDALGENEIEINDETVEIEIEDGVLTITIDEESDVSAELDVKVLTSEDEIVYLEYKPVVIDIDFSEFGIYKSGKVRIV